RRALAIVLLLVRGVADAAREGDAGRVGRPNDRLDRLAAIGELARLATLCWYDVQLCFRLCLVLTVASGGEREPAAVRGPARRGVAALAGCELSRLRGAVDRHDPDRAAVRALLAVDRRDDVRDQPPIGREARVFRAPERVDIVGPHAPILT